MIKNKTEELAPNYCRINHSYKPEIIVPLSAVENNIALLIYENVSQAIMGDGTTCTIESVEEVHICDLDKDIQRLYNTTPWLFITKWHSIYPKMYSMFFLKIKLSQQ